MFHWKWRRGNRFDHRRQRGGQNDDVDVHFGHQSGARERSFGRREIQCLPPHEIVRLRLCQSPEGRKIFPRLDRSARISNSAR